MTDTTQAAQRCADLANADEINNTYQWDAQAVLDGVGIIRAFRREVERKDAMIREVLALLDQTIPLAEYDKARMDKAIDLLRADLLPVPQPTLLEVARKIVAETIYSRPDWRDMHDEVLAGQHDQLDHVRSALAALDWIAKREKEA